MFSAYPFLTERTPPKKRRKKVGSLKASPAQKTSPSSFPWNVQLEGASGPCAGVVVAENFVLTSSSCVGSGLSVKTPLAPNLLTVRKIFLHHSASEEESIALLQTGP